MEEKRNCHLFQTSIVEQEILLGNKPLLDAILPEDMYSEYDLYRSEYVMQHTKTNKNEVNHILKNAAIDNLKNREKIKFFTGLIFVRNCTQYCIIYFIINYN